MTITINDLPIDILIHIFSMCEEDNLDKDPYLLWNYRAHRIVLNKNVSRVPLQWIPNHEFKSTKKIQEYKIPILPSSISKLCNVSQSFNLAAMELWKPFCETNIKKDKYKNKHPPSFYRSRVYSIIDKYIDLVINKLKKHEKYHRNMCFIESNNAEKYLQTIKLVEEDDKYDKNDKDSMYYVYDLLFYVFDDLNYLHNEGYIRTFSMNCDMMSMIDNRKDSLRDYENYRHKYLQNMKHIKYMNQRKQRLS